MEFNQEDLSQIEDQGLTVARVMGQLEMFKRGFPATKVVTPAVIGNGILALSEEEKRNCISVFDEKKKSLDIVKFVPASGAATRMFKELHTFLSDYNPEQESIEKFAERKKLRTLEEFFSQISNFAFLYTMRKCIRSNYPDYKYKTKRERYLIMARCLLLEDGLNFANLPKGLIPFHKYNKYYTTAFEEQLYEGCFYASSNNSVFAHFTFAPDHVDYFKDEFEAVKSRVEKKTKKEVHVSYSFQNSSTNTIAVTLENEPFRDENGRLVFRPAGHGSLLDNLNDVDADLVFIKNIDNVIAEEYVDQIAYYKKILAGKLLALQNRVFNYAEQLQQESSSEDLIAEVKSFMWNELHIKDLNQGNAELFTLLNRPIRVCGMVKNTGSVGGGPFWVADKSGVQSLQIVESAQIDLKDPSQRNVFHEATHFNPVDVVCGVRDFNGNKFDLTAFTDPNTGFITQKDHNGCEIKALELPGLWNGGMANWITIFVEVPLITFNPVKTVNDLLHKEHQPNL